VRDRALVRNKNGVGWKWPRAGGSWQVGLAPG